MSLSTSVIDPVWACAEARAHSKSALRLSRLSAFIHEEAEEEVEVAPRAFSKRKGKGKARA